MLIQLAFLVMIVYLACNLGRCRRVESRILLSLASVGSIALSIVASFGLAWMCGFPYTPIHSVIPFVVSPRAVAPATQSFFLLRRRPALAGRPPPEGSLACL